ncbi:hypothetical protein EDD37DRAFT_206959 [Exophiala viscosa]|uniref:uncharacterized protein n=1 Tax=Exophiala viscosa TaxID=2486360 RepID=UPI002195C945|nr:hypothetical protein EDD37DRAFT_206959 [Exophiala viscosa]
MRCFIVVIFIHALLNLAVTIMSSSNELSPATPSLTPSQLTTQSKNHHTITIPVTQTAPLLPPVITIAPLALNPLGKRQRCFDDRGVSVNCQTWTGYYYTWGPAGNPYEGGPGEGGGSGSGGGNGGNAETTVVVYQNDTARLDLTSWSALLAMLLLGVLLFL